MAALSFECLSPDEVRKKYDGAEDKAEMLVVLADLTDATERDVARFLGISIPASARFSRIDPNLAFKLFEEGLSDQQMAVRLGVTRKGVYEWRISKNLIRRAKSTDEERMDLYKRGYSDTAAAEMLGMNRGTFRAWRVAQGLPSNNERRRQHE